MIFPWVLVLGFGMSKGCNKILVEFPWVKCHFIWNFLGQSDKPKSSGVFLEKVYPQPSVWIALLKNSKKKIDENQLLPIILN